MDSSVERVLCCIKRQNISPFRETQAPAFLTALCGHHDPLIAPVAQFELALLKVRQGDPHPYVVPWNVEPQSVLSSLARDRPLAENLPESAFEVHVSRDLPSLFQIVPVGAREAPLVPAQ